MAKIETKVTTKLPLTNGKEATLTLEDGVVEIKTPVSFGYPKVALEDLIATVEELKALELQPAFEHLTANDAPADGEG